MLTTTARTLTRLATAILLPCHLAVPTAAKAEQYPIWWSPTLELESLDNIAPGYDWMCRQYRANERRIPLSRFEAERNVQLKVLNDFKIEGRTDWWFYDVEILARADFNRDGLEDLLVIASADATEDTWGATTIFLLNRDTPDGVFWVVDAEEELCTNYRPCDAHYDEPAALR